MIRIRFFGPGELNQNNFRAARYPGLIVASMGANRKEKSGGTITARVLHDGSNGIPVNRRTRVRDRERCPMASDLKRGMREKARRGERTFALTGDVKEAHQIPVARRDWRLLGCRVRPGTCTGCFSGQDFFQRMIRTFGLGPRAQKCLFGPCQKTETVF